jgi:hypothetical protein
VSEMSKFERGCPNCGGKAYAGIEVNSFDCRLKVTPWYLNPGHSIEPRICLNCGTVYVDSITVSEINTRAKEHNSCEK